MTENSTELRKRNWIDRMINIYHNLEFNVLYTPPSVRELLRNNFDDSISHKTIRELLDKMIEAQKHGIQCKVGNKFRKLIVKKTINEDKLYELIEY